LFFSKGEKLYSNQPLYRGNLPNINLVMGTYLNSCSPDHDTLILTGGYGLIYFLLSKDSSGKSFVLRGRWGYNPLGVEVIEKSPARFNLYPEGDPRFWIARLSIKVIGKDDVQIVIDTLQAFMKMTSKQMSKAYQEHWVDSGSGVRFNSIGRPYCFIKELHADQ